MTDAHFHRQGYDTLLVVDDVEFRFAGFHPWQVAEMEFPDFDALRATLVADSRLGVGEIGMDRLRAKNISERQRTAFERQLALAAELCRPVVLHGAKCWGEVVKACQLHRERIPALLFHGFSRSTGLLPDIFALNGYVSLGPALLNDHAVNYREMAKTLPLERLLIETDQDWESSVEGGDVPASRDAQAAQLAAIVAQLAVLRGESEAAIEKACAANARRFTESLA